MLKLFFKVSKRSIANFPFPAVTICATGDGKWSAIINALDHYDRSVVFHSGGVQGERRETQAPPIFLELKKAVF